MYLNEARNEREKKDLAMIIEEMLLQRYQGAVSYTHLLTFFCPPAVNPGIKIKNAV